jgi:type IV secretory pathway VirB10-like protein
MPELPVRGIDRRSAHDHFQLKRSPTMAQAKTKKASTSRTRKPAAKKKPAAKRSTAAAKKSTTSRKKPAARKSTAKKASTRKRVTGRGKAAVDRTQEISDDVLKSVDSGQKAAIDAVRKFVDTVDEALPDMPDLPAERDAVIDAALEMADDLVTSQHEFLQSVVRSAESSLGRKSSSKGRKKTAKAKPRKK